MLTDASNNSHYDAALDFSSSRVEIEDEEAWQTAVDRQPLEAPQRRERCVALLMAKLQHSDGAVQAEGLHGLWELGLVPDFAHELSMGAIPCVSLCTPRLVQVKTHGAVQGICKVS